MRGEPVAQVQSVFDFAVREINALEQQIITAEDDADAKLWEQAERVVAQLDAGMSQRQMAEQWINARTGQPYSQMHVSYVARVFAEKYTFQPRPRFRDAYNEIANPSKDKPHVAQNSGNNEWYTPKEHIAAARAVLGDIDLDPASSPAANAIVQASQIFTEADNGLAHPWHGRVWMNPPYAQPAIGQFCEKLTAHVAAGDVTQAIVLVNNGTETQWFAALMSQATALCLPTGRITFWHPEKDAATPLQGQAIVYFGPDVDRFQAAFAGFGQILRPVQAAA